MEFLHYYLLFIFIFFSIYFSIKIIKKEKRSIFIKILIILVFLYFFLIYLPESNNFFEILALIQLLLLLLIPIAILLGLIIYINNLRKEKQYLNNFTIITQFQPPSKIHPAVAGYLIDKKIGKREFFATLFNTIINGHIVVDERIENNEYKYYLLKNKGFSKSISCDRLVSNYIFNRNNIYLDAISFKNMGFGTHKIKSFISDELVKLKYFENPYFTKQRTPINVIDLDRFEKEKIDKIEKSWSSQFKYLNEYDRINYKNKIDKKIFDIKETIKYLKNKKIRPRKVLKSNFKNSYTQLGAEERAKWLGFKDYLQTAERFRMDEEKVETFSKYLPYAVALGVQTQWARRFENMDVNRLEWFRSQKSESIRRHDSQKVYFKHLIKFLGQIYVK